MLQENREEVQYIVGLYICCNCESISYAIFTNWSETHCDADSHYYSWCTSWYSV